MRHGLFCAVEGARTFQHNINAQIVPGQICWIAVSKKRNRTAPNINALFGGPHCARKIAVYAVIAQQMGMSFNRTGIVDGNDFDIFALQFMDGAISQTTNTTEAVDGDTDCHMRIPQNQCCAIAEVEAS